MAAAISSVTLAAETFQNGGQAFDDITKKLEAVFKQKRYHRQAAGKTLRLIADFANHDRTGSLYCLELAH